MKNTFESAYVNNPSLALLIAFDQSIHAGLPTFRIMYIVFILIPNETFCHDMDRMALYNLLFFLAK